MSERQHKDNSFAGDFGNYADMLVEEISQQTTESQSANADQFGLFNVKPAHQWLEQANNRPIPKMLFGEMWHEGELCILFADTNLGKSILTVQIGDSISQGRAIPGSKLEAPKQPILYFDFELSDKQFEARYSVNYQQHYRFDRNFLRAEINPDCTLPESQTFEDYLNASLEQSIIQTGARVLIIDNLTYLRNETERAKDALPLMKHLKALKSRYGLSILALAHTPKRDLTKPLTRNDLQGSKMLINFCDSAFALGESSQDKQIRYLKQVKARNTEIIYDSENVCLYQIAKPHNFLQFEWIGYGSERQHLRQQSEQDKAGIVDRVKEMVTEGKSQRVIASEIGISLGAVNKYAKQ
ncbi:AAA family ATPase [Spirosoma panaciterrae]|uniref:AAA family ATPase n=1 Tax=Spirosoma panaciterrae TaxID=496058 RepID=UPI00035C09FE|nr:AAA family ATPase [Spirosoma panaciterrae]